MTKLKQQEMRKPRIAVLITSMAGGGAERAVTMLLNSLDKEKYELHLIVNRFEGPYCAQVPPYVQVTEMRAPRLRLALPRLIRSLHKVEPDVVIANLWENNVMAVAAKRWCKRPYAVIVCEHSAISRKRPPGTNSLRRLCYKRADAVVGCSAAMGDEIHRLLRIPQDRIRVIYNAVIDQGFNDRKDEECRHPWFCDEKSSASAVESGSAAPIIVSLGRLSPEKRYDLVIEAAARLRRSGLPIRVILIGEGADRTRLEHIRSELGADQYVDLPGYTANPLPYLKRADLYVQSSDVEGLPTALIEAIACGTPVVATLTATGTTEVLAGVKGAVTVPCGDVEAMTQAIWQQLQALRIDAAATSLEPDLRFTAEHASGQYEALIDELLASDGHGIQHCEQERRGATG
ncbi:glycosyltransferase [Paenibacillus sp. UMB4589-SE434]|uniref:glycosyltransferase n=1 Tax=Paenibacillus sp. UMB4589-SE434 TaxID=3046314 RepID=UPI0025511D42|nr:glycosyltransferase [Paenibacillus sp. UMB4589-SE434]MDK8182004.1 glycosyltransferase [Paenibacillus sp. UMB4589-SE434]